MNVTFFLDRTPLTAHVYGNTYENRYRLHAFSGYELSNLPSTLAWSIGGSRRRCDWLGLQSSQIPGPGEVCVPEQCAWAARCNICDAVLPDSCLGETCDTSCCVKAAKRIDCCRVTVLFLTHHAHSVTSHKCDLYHEFNMYQCDLFYAFYSYHECTLYYTCDLYHEFDLYYKYDWCHTCNSHSTTL